jgi:hypothetical protein
LLPHIPICPDVDREAEKGGADCAIWQNRAGLFAGARKKLCDKSGTVYYHAWKQSVFFTFKQFSALHKDGAWAQRSGVPARRLFSALPTLLAITG